MIFFCSKVTETQGEAHPGISQGCWAWSCIREALQEERVQPAGPVPVLTLPWELGSTGSWRGQICRDSPRALASNTSI